MQVLPSQAELPGSSAIFYTLSCKEIQTFKINYYKGKLYIIVFFLRFTSYKLL